MNEIKTILTALTQQVIPRSEEGDASCASSSGPRSISTGEENWLELSELELASNLNSSIGIEK